MISLLSWVRRSSLDHRMNLAAFILFLCALMTGGGMVIGVLPTSSLLPAMFLGVAMVLALLGVVTEGGAAGSAYPAFQGAKSPPASSDQTSERNVVVGSTTGPSTSPAGPNTRTPPTTESKASTV